MYLQIDVCIFDCDLHGENLGGGVILQEESEVSQRCHEEVGTEGL